MTMSSFRALQPASALVLLVSAWVARAWAVDPPTTAFDDTVEDCTLWTVADADSTCETLAGAGSITEDELVRLNPSLEDGCAIEPEWSYCTEENWGIPLPPTTTTPAESSSGAEPTPTGGNGIETPSPAMPGLDPDCGEFHFVEDGEICSSIAKDAGISLDDFLEWNPESGENCETLWKEAYVCIGVIGDEGGDEPPPTTTITAPPDPENGIETPTPIMPKMTKDCDKFYFVEDGDICDTIVKDHSITVEEFVEWNPSVGDECGEMWKEAYVCVGVLGD